VNIDGRGLCDGLVKEGNDQETATPYSSPYTNFGGFQATAFLAADADAEEDQMGLRRGIKIEK